MHNSFVHTLYDMIRALYAEQCCTHSIDDTALHKLLSPHYATYHTPHTASHTPQYMCTTTFTLHSSPHRPHTSPITPHPIYAIVTHPGCNPYYNIFTLDW